MGLERLNAGFLLHVLQEQSSNQQLNANHLKSSMDRWWANCIRNEDERAFIGELIAEVRSGEKEFTKEMYHDLLERRRKTGSLSWEDKQEQDVPNETNTTQTIEENAITS
jgi:hypothetical protein